MTEDQGFDFGGDGSVFDLALEQLDFFGGEIEQAIDAGVDFRFGVGEVAGVVVGGGSVFGEVRFPAGLRRASL